MSRSECGALVALCFVLSGCRGGDVAATDAAVDHRYTPTSEVPAEAPRVDPPTAIGGGPTSDDVYSSSGALNVLSAAWCARANACGSTASNCEADAAQKHGPDLARCVKGVDASVLSDCAQQVRTTSCDSGVALAETCTAAVMCVRD